LLSIENISYPQILWITLWKFWGKTDQARMNVTAMLKWLQIKRA
jgi:hypothetical protein